MTAKEACEAIEKGLKNIDTDAQIVKVPMADGGEGTVQALVDALNGKIITKKVTGPLNKPVTKTARRNRNVCSKRYSIRQS